jgi:hypothetical protein
MNTMSKIIFITTPLLTAALSAQAEVKSLSSSELTDTYIKDSTIIVTPKKQEIETEQKTYSSLTIAPVENVDQDFDKLAHLQNHVSGTTSSVLLDENMLRNAAIDSIFVPDMGISIPTYQEINTKPMEEVMGDTRYAVPDGDFDYTYVGGEGSKDLGLSLQDNQLTFSIGNLPQIDKIEIPHSVNEGPVQITPRVGGGLDLTFTVPDRN